MFVCPQLFTRADRDERENSIELCFHLWKIKWQLDELKIVLIDGHVRARELCRDVTLLPL